jgi:hypothetical protein
MKSRIAVWTLGAIFVLVSCKNKSEGDNTTDTTTNSTTTTTTNEGMNGNIGAASIEVPTNIRSTFDTKYPQATNVQWTYYRPVEPYYIDWDWSGWQHLDSMDYVTTYNWQGTDYTTWYDDQGTWVGTVSTVSDYNSLPPAVNATIQKQYGGYTISSVKKENDKNRTAYEVMVDNGNGSSGKLLIDENGKIMKKKINMGDSKMKEKMNPKDSAQ